MKKIYRRWYEKNRYLSAFMALMKDIPKEIQCEIAIDMILKESDYIDRNYTKIIKDVANFNPRDYKRWYDKNPNVHLALEMLRELDENQRIEILKEFCDRLIASSGINIDEQLGNEDL